MNNNVIELTVSEFSSAIKTIVEDAFGYLRIRGEIIGFKKASSGHLYFNLKDQNASLNAVCFRNHAQLINFELADGLQVSVSGKVSTFEGRSSYQIIVEKIEIAGLGAILEMLEKRKQKLFKEGLFDQVYKKILPFFPKTIGVITSKTGAVIEDIKHRIADRCPTRILLYHATMQGEKTVSEVCAGIRFFDNMKNDRCDLIIIARGGGSFEDLLPFSDEELVRTAFKCDIPIISAIGHETDNCLLDLVADFRAPTPTASAEIATPVLSELIIKINRYYQDVEQIINHKFKEIFLDLKNIKKHLSSPKQALSDTQNNLLNLILKINFSVDKFFNQKFLELENKNSLNLDNVIDQHKLIINNNYQQTKLIVNNYFNNYQGKINSLNFIALKILDYIDNSMLNIDQKSKIINRQLENFIKSHTQQLISLQKSLASNHYQNILRKGFTLIKNQDKQLVDSPQKALSSQELFIEFAEGEVLIKNYHINSCQSENQ